MRWIWFLAAAACSPPEAAPQAAALPTLRIVGSETINAALMPALVEGHQQISGALDFTVAGGGSTAGFKALLDGEAEIAAASRPPIPAEVEQARVYGWDFDRHLVGLSVIALEAHPSNPLESLTYGQARDLFCTGAITDWSELGLEARPVRLVVRDRRSGSRVTVEDFLCGLEGIHPTAEVLDAEGIGRALRDDPAAIGFAPLWETSGKVLALRPRNEAAPISPTPANVLRGRYPLFHDVALYTAGAPSDEAAAFLGWVVGPLGQQVVEEHAIMPVHKRPALLTGPRPLRETLTFAHGSTEADARSHARLEVLVDELTERAGEVDHVILEGFADASEDEPLTLSHQRAQAIREALQQRLPALFVEIIPRGANRPAAPEDTPLGQAANRRVQVYLAEEERTGQVDAEVVDAEAG